MENRKFPFFMVYRFHIFVTAPGSRKNEFLYSRTSCFPHFLNGNIYESHLWCSVQDFYLDLTEDGRRITPRDYLESALQPIPGTGKAIASKNEVSRACL